MQVIARRTLKQFWERHPPAERPLQVWFGLVSKARWDGPADVKRQFGSSVDFVSDNRVIFDLGGKVALVTGASGGLGLHFARTLADAGARVALAARRKEQLEANVAAITGAGRQAIAVAMDVTDPESVERGVAEVARRFDGPATIIVNNSGVTAAEPALDLDPAEWDKVMDTNVKGAWLVARVAARRMIDAAHAYGVPVVRDMPIARALRDLEVGEEIPEALYEAVAEILREIWAQQQGEPR